MYSVYIYCKDKLVREDVNAEKQFPHSSFCLGLALLCPWHGPQAQSGDRLPKIIGLKNKYKSIIVQLKDSLELEGQRKDRGVGGWCKLVCE